jgi:hypothetical protein
MTDIKEEFLSEWKEICLECGKDVPEENIVVYRLKNAAQDREFLGKGFGIGVLESGKRVATGVAGKCPFCGSDSFVTEVADIERYRKYHKVPGEHI